MSLKIKNDFSKNNNKKEKKIQSKLKKQIEKNITKKTKTAQNKKKNIVSHKIPQNIANFLIVEKDGSDYCWLCDYSKLEFVENDKWICKQCKDFYLKCFKCKENGVDTFDSYEDDKGCYCTGCYHFFCQNCWYDA